MVLENAAGEVMFSKEQDIYEQIGRLDRRIDNWQDALPDLNGRMKKLEEVLGQVAEESKKQTAKFREIQQGVDNVMKVSARAEGEFLARMKSLERALTETAQDVQHHSDYFKDAGVRLVNLECFELHHPEDHTKITDEIVKLETATKLMNESIKDLCERMARSESCYNKMLDFTDQKMARYEQRFAGLESKDQELKEKEIDALRLELKDLKNQGFRHDMDLDYLKQATASAPPTKIPEDASPLPTEENIRCGICVNCGEGGMNYEISGYRVGAKGCRLLQSGETVYFRGTKCKRFEERE